MSADEGRVSSAFTMRAGLSRWTYLAASPESALICLLILHSGPALASGPFPCQNTPMDIRDKRGVFTDKIPGSRVEYDPFPKNFRIRPGLPFSLEFKTVAPSGLIFVAGDLDRGNIVGAYLNNGMLTFARHCGYGRVYEMHHQRTLNDGEWHSLKYRHDRRGGRLELDGRDHFRSYHMGPCSDFSSVFFGGLSPNTVLGRLTTEEDQHRFSGCLRNLRFDGRLPVLHPNYYAVSSCS